MTVTASGSREYGIPTTYRGTRFRSRLEAKWAAFFDLIGWKWIYEPMDADGYIPDFLITGARPFFVEVGPVYSLAEYKDKAQKADRAVESLGRDLLVVGLSAVADIPYDCFAVPAVGWLGEISLAFDEPGCGYSWGRGNWGLCYGEDHAVGVWHDYMNYSHRPCGVGKEDTDAMDSWLMDRWSEAGNSVQWRSR